MWAPIISTHDATLNPKNYSKIGVVRMKTVQRVPTNSQLSSFTKICSYRRALVCTTTSETSATLKVKCTFNVDAKKSIADYPLTILRMQR